MKHVSIFFFLVRGGLGWRGLGVLKYKYIRSLQTSEAYRVIAKDFQKIWNLQNCIGAMNCTMLWNATLKLPFNSSSLYINYKG